MKKIIRIHLQLLSKIQINYNKSNVKLQFIVSSNISREVDIALQIICYSI